MVLLNVWGIILCIIGYVKGVIQVYYSFIYDGNYKHYNFILYLVN